MAKKRDSRPATAKLARELLDRIERDRTAAAAELGVSLDEVRSPMPTADSKPVRRHAATDYEGTFPPPIAAQAYEPTQMAEPISKRKTHKIAAVVISLGVVGAALAVVLGAKKSEKKPAPAIVNAPAEPPPPPPQPAIETKPVETKPVETKPVETTQPSEPAGNPVDAKAAGSASTPKTTKTKTTKTAQTTKTKVVETKPEPKPEPKVIDAATLAAHYQSVGTALKSLEQAKGPDATSDLWPRYRFVKLSSAMRTQQSRDEAAAILAKLSSEIAARKR